MICACSELDQRLFKSGAAILGFMSHLALDELYSVEWRGGRWQVKSSFGTAIKFWSKSWLGNLSTYAKLLIVGFLVVGDPIFMERFGWREDNIHTHAREKLEEVLR